jgi:choline dehydrogenase-like flavoprotein
LKDTVDFVVIGSGAAGGVMAKELSEAGFSVVVLEQGPWLKEKDFVHDEIKFTMHSPLTNDQKRQPVTFRENDTMKARPRRVIGYGRQVGGGTVHFTANYWRFHESDFHERSLYGDVPGTGFADWPLSYAELEPYYTKAEYEMGISGVGGANPFEGHRSKPYPLPPMPAKSSGALLERAAKKLGLHAFPGPMAVLSKPYRGRSACTNCGSCEFFGCEMRAKSSTLASVIPMALKTGRCEVRPDSYVRQIKVNAVSRVAGVVYFDARGREVFQKAKAVALCANGVESPRLLLNSKSSQFTEGLANSSGLVGKYLMWDNGAFTCGLFEKPLNEFKGIQVGRVLHDYYRADSKRGFYGGGGIDARFNFYPVGFGLYGLPADAPKWGAEYKRMLGEYFTRTMSLLSHTTSLPQLKNDVSLDPDVRDAWGLPAARITYSPHPDDLATLRWIQPRQEEILNAAGAKRVWNFPVDSVETSFHLMGTCRMGRDPKASVVDPYSRSHDVPNLYVVDGSNFVTSARQQPTATIQALAYRASAQIIAAGKRGDL